MSAATTTYDVRVRYMMQDRASAGMERLEGRARRAARQTGFLGAHLKTVAATFATGYGLRLGYNWLVKYNAELEDTHAQLRTMIQLNQGGSFARAHRLSAELMEGFREDAKKSAGSLKDMSDFAARIIGPFTRAGGKLKELRELNRGAVVASQIMRIPAEVAAFDIEQALAGTLTKRERFARAVLEPMGHTTKSFNALSAAERRKELVKAFNQPELKRAAKEYENSFAGVSSTFRDNLEQAAGLVGKPLFKALNEEFKRANAWFEKNQAKVEAWAKNVGATIRSIFHGARDAIGWLVEHKDTLLAVAKAALLIKGGSILVGWGKQVAGFMAAIKALAQTNLVRSGVFSAALWLKVNSGLVSMVGKLGLVGGALGAVYLAASSFADWLDRRQDAAHKRIVDTVDLREAGKRFSSDLGADRAYMRSRLGRDPTRREIGISRSAQLLRAARAHGLISEAGAINRDAVRSMLIRAPGVGISTLGHDVRGSMLPRSVDEYVKKLEIAHQLGADAMRERAMIVGARNFAKVFKKAAEDWRAAMYGFVADVAMAGVPGGGLFGAVDPFGLRAALVENLKDTKPEVDIGSLTIEVRSEDPHRFAVGLEGVFRDWLRSPTQAPTTFREG